MTDIILVKFGPHHSVETSALPLGILYLGDGLQKKSFSVALFHESGSKKAVHKLIQKVNEEKTLFVGFSNFRTSSPHIAKHPYLGRKRTSRTPIVWGGVHSAIFPEETLKGGFVLSPFFTDCFLFLFGSYHYLCPVKTYSSLVPHFTHVFHSRTDKYLEKKVKKVFFDHKSR